MGTSSLEYCRSPNTSLTFIFEESRGKHGLSNKHRVYCTKLFMQFTLSLQQPTLKATLLENTAVFKLKST